MPDPMNARWYDPTALTEKMKDPEVANCPNCDCTFFEQITVHQFPRQHNVILGQRVQPIGDIGFYVFRCIKCKEVFEPQVQAGARDVARRMYDDFLDMMQAPVDSKKNTGEKL